MLLVAAYLRPIWVLTGAMVAIPLEGFGNGALIGPSQAVLGAVAAGWTLRWATARPITVPKHPALIAFALLIVANAAGLLLADEPDIVIRQVFNWGTMLVVALCLAETAGGRSVRNVLLAFAVCGGVGGLISVASPQSLTGFVFGAGQVTRATGGLGSPNVLGGLLAMTVPFQLIFMLRGSPRVRLLAGGCLALALAGMTLAVSRGAFIGLAASLLVLLAWGPFRRAALIVIPPVLVIAIAGDNPVSAKLDAQQVITRLAETNTAESVDLRFKLWKATPRMVRDKPIFGVGAFEYGHSAPKYDIPSSQGTPPHAHNLLLTIVAELGLFGLCGVPGLARRLVLGRNTDDSGTDRNRPGAGGGRLRRDHRDADQRHCSTTYWASR